MKRQIKFLLLFFIVSPLVVKAQVKKVQFFKIHAYEYDRPVLVTEGKYKAYFLNQGEQRVGGDIIINEQLKSFKINWIDGDYWEAKIKSKEVKSEVDELLGQIKRTYYFGNWIDDKFECALVITEMPNGCMYALKSKRVIDKGYGINTWKKNISFATSGECSY